MSKPTPNMMSRVKSSLSWGPVVGLWALFYTIIEAMVLFVTEFFLPEQDIDISRSFDSKVYNVNSQEYGCHEFVVDSANEKMKNKREPIIADLKYNSLDNYFDAGAIHDE